MSALVPRFPLRHCLQRFSTVSGFSFARRTRGFVQSARRADKPIDTAPEYAGIFQQTKSLIRDGILESESGIPLVDAIHLRNSCVCSRCVNPSSGQKNYSIAEVPPSIRIRDYHFDAHSNNVHVSWENDVPGFGPEHITTLDTRSIVKSGPFEARGTTEPRSPLRLWEGSTFDPAKATLAYEDFMTDDTKLDYALQQIHIYGLVFIKDVPPDEDSVAKLALRIGPIRNTFYGRTWDVRSKPDAENVAYTNEYLGFHMDLLYMKEPPGIQFLHCIENTCDGGESAFVDSFRAALHLLRESPLKYRALEDDQIPYQYHRGGHKFFDEKPVILQGNASTVMRYNKGDYWKRAPQEIEDIRRIYWSPPFVSHDVPVEGIGFFKNEDHTEEPRNYRRSAAIQHARKAFSDILEREDLRVETKLPAGTCAIFNNLRVVHARKAFNTASGHRWLRGTYIDEQDFVSKALALESRFRPFEEGAIGEDDSS